MNVLPRNPELLKSDDPDYVAGMLEYQARCALRDLIDCIGEEPAREAIDRFFEAEIKRRSRQ